MISEKLLGAKPLDYATDIMNMLEPIIVDVTDQTEQEKYLKQRVIDAVNDCPEKKVGYLVMEIKDKGCDKECLKNGLFSKQIKKHTLSTKKKIIR